MAATVIPAPGPHGGDAAAIARALRIPVDDVLDLSQSLNPCAPAIGALASRHLGSLRRYPDAASATLSLAEHLGVDPGRTMLTNGGSEAIALVAAELGGTVVAEPEFGLHPRAGGGPLWASNPNNPTGLLADGDATADVWDEAFYGLATGQWTRGDRDAVVVGSLTKVFACPGLRIGYVIADDVERFLRRQPTWAVNSLAIAVLPDLLAVTDLGRWRQEIEALRRALVAVLARHGIATEPSDAPWVLAKAAGLRERLAPHGVVVRDCSSFGMPDHVRIAVPIEAALERLDRALETTG
jgi:histidinol-phosphate/aromatic aminotransferase/cobyric acid decarboxylase-like protein